MARRRGAITAINALAEVDPFWIEEPLMPDDVRGLATIREKVQVPIATGEIEATRWGFGALLEQRAIDMLQPDSTVLGGITEFRKVAGLAAALDVPLYPHWMHHPTSPSSRRSPTPSWSSTSRT